MMIITRITMYMMMIFMMLLLLILMMTTKMMMKWQGLFIVMIVLCGVNVMINKTVWKQTLSA